MPVLARQSDPQFQYVIADPSKSTGYNPWQQATALYNKMYGFNPLDMYTSKPFVTGGDKGWQNQWTGTKNSSFLSNTPDPNNFAGQTGIGNIGTVGLNTFTGQIGRPQNVNFLKWYAAAQNPEVLNDPILKEMLMESGKMFSMTDDQIRKMQMWTARTPGYDPLLAVQDKYLKEGKAKGLSPVQLRDLKDELEGKRYQFSLAALNPISAKDVQTSFAMYAGPKVQELRKKALAEGGVNLETFLKGDAQNYANAVLQGYIEGPNASLRSFNGGPFTVTTATNRSKNLGGEDLANDTFEYYKSRSTPGQIGSNWAATANPFVQQGTFNNQQSFFTPYDYAVTGRFNPTLNKTELSNLDPNFWLNQGNLQNINNQWGFVTGQDPFASVANPTRLLDKENTSIRHTTTGGGFLSNLLSPANLASIAGWAFGIPALSLPGTIGSGVDFLENYLGSKKSGKGNTNFQRPVQAPTWYIPGA